MGKIATDLSDIEQKAFEAVQDTLSNYVKSDRLKPVRNEGWNYFSIKLDSEDGLELCFISHRKNGSLNNIGFPKVEYDIASHNIASYKDKLLHKLQEMSVENDIPLP